MYFCGRGWIAEFLKIIVKANDFGHIIDPFVQNFVKGSSINDNRVQAWGNYLPSLLSDNFSYMYRSGRPQA